MRNHVLAPIVAVLCLVGWSTLATAAERPKSLTLGSASPGGVYYIYGEGVARLLTEKLAITVNHLPTQGPVHNVRLIESGGADFGMITMGVGLQGWNGSADWTGGQRFRKMRALFPMYDTPFHIVVLKRSGISTVAQLEQKRIGVGPRAGTGGTYIPVMMKLLGISAHISNGSFANMASELFAGGFDAIVTLTGAPMPAIQEAGAKEPITFIDLSSEQRDTIRKAIPELSSSIIPAGTYPSLDKDYMTLGVYNFVVARADLPDDVAYNVVKAIHENQALLVQIHPAGRETLPQNTDKNTFLPFHPGAARYYREIGIKIPDFLVPTH
jgi:TRAP transporter TAXI family solute receptor